MPEQMKNLYNLSAEASTDAKAMADKEALADKEQAKPSSAEAAEGKAEAEKVREKASKIAGGGNAKKEDYEETEKGGDLLKEEKQKELNVALFGAHISDAQKVIDFTKKNNIELNIFLTCQNAIRKCLIDERPAYVEEIINFVIKNNIEFNLNKPEIVQYFQKELETYLYKKIDSGTIEKIIDFIKENNNEFNLNKPEIVQAFEERFKYLLSNGYFYYVEKIINLIKKHGIELNIIRVFQEELAKVLSGKNFSRVAGIIEIIKNDNIKIDITQIFKEELEKNIFNENLYGAEKIIKFVEKNNEYGIKFDLNKPKIVRAFQKGLERNAFSGYFSEVEKIVNTAKKNSIKLNLSISALNYPQEATINDILEITKIPQIGERFADSLHQLTSFSFPNQIKPIISAQGEVAFLYFESIKEIEGYQNLSAEDTEYITRIAKKYGTQARNILDNILVKVDSISGEREAIEEFIQDIGIIHFDIYKQYKQAKEENDQKKIIELKEGIKELHSKIYQGDMEEKDFDNELYSAVSYHTFPPAIGITQDQYDRLNKERPDRRSDVSKKLNELQYEKFNVSTGKYNLGENEELNLEKWTSLGDTIKKVNAEMEKGEEVKINEEEIAGKLIKMYKEKNAEKKENQDYMFENMYRYHLANNGGKMESGFEISIQGLMQYKEFIGDRIKNDLIKDCLSKWQATHKEEFAELQKDTLNRIKSSQAKNFAKVKNILKAIDKQKDEAKKEKTIQGLDEFLKHFGLSYESVKEKGAKELEQELETVIVEYEGELTEENYRSEEYYNSQGFLKAYDEFLSKHDKETLVYQKISADLIAGINKKMRKEVDKFQFAGEAGKAEKRELEFAISKKKEHGIAGYNMGVCVAPDKRLWNDKEFMNCIIFDPKLKQAMGGMHFLIRENNLCLPGINPSLDVLSSVKNEELFDKMIKYAEKVKEKLGLDKILIPTNSTIHSNRTQIQEIIRNKNFKKYNLKQDAKFSYSPYEYSFQECYEAN